MLKINFTYLYISMLYICVITNAGFLAVCNFSKKKKERKKEKQRQVKMLKINFILYYILYIYIYISMLYMCNHKC